MNSAERPDHGEPLGPAKTVTLTSHTLGGSVRVGGHSKQRSERLLCRL